MMPTPWLANMLFAITLTVLFDVFCPAKEDSSTLSGGSPRCLFSTGGPHLLQEPQLSRGDTFEPLLPFWDVLS